MLRLFLFLALVAIPIAEISLFIVVGGVIGALPTILIIVLTALIGTVLLRRQGAAALAALQRDLDRGEIPAAAIGHAVTIAIAGLLLLTPGFITDAAGFALFVPGVRRWLWQRMSGVINIQGLKSGAAGFRRSGGPTVDLDEDDYTAHSTRPGHHSGNGPHGQGGSGPHGPGGRTGQTRGPAPTLGPRGTPDPTTPWNPNG